MSAEDGHILGGDEWNPQYIIPSNINANEYHWNFVKYELQNALNKGAKEIGLDAFTNMEIAAQFDWIREIKSQVLDQGKDIKFMQEGIICDYLHTEFSMFLQPYTGWFDKDATLKFNSSPILADYLNPDAEIIVYLEKDINEV